MSWTFTDVPVCCHAFGVDLPPPDVPTTTTSTTVSSYRNIQASPPSAESWLNRDRFANADGTSSTLSSSPVISSSRTTSSTLIQVDLSQTSWPDHEPSSSILPFYTSFTSSSQTISSSTTDATNLNSSSSNNNDGILTNHLLLQAKPISKRDTVKRVIDSSTIQLQSLGYVSLETVRGAGSTYQLPECMDFAPSYKLKQLLRKGTEVRVFSLRDLSSQPSSGGGGVSASTITSSSTSPRVWIVRSQDDMMVNRELVRSGFAFVRKGVSTNTANELMDEVLNDLIGLEQNARRQGLGIFRDCDANISNDHNANGLFTKTDHDTTMSSMTTVSSANFIAEFEPLDYTTETQWGDDGGKTILVQNKASSSSVLPPSNPGDVKGCSDFATYEESLSWYETYFPLYGDVAKLDRDGDGIPCPGLPHTSVRERYRMKRPTTSGHS